MRRWDSEMIAAPALGLEGSVCYPTIFTLSTRGSKLRLDLSLGRWIYMVLRQHSVSLLQHQSTSEEKHGRLLAVETAGPFCVVSLKQLTALEQRQGRLQDPQSLQCQ